MYRVLTVVIAGLTLAACSSNSQWLNLDAFKAAPIAETVQFESTPPGADVKLSNGQTCRTPCALAIPHPESETGSYSAVFTLTGFLPDTEQIQLLSMGDGTSKFRPNPVVVELTAEPPPPKPKKKIRHRAHTAKPAAAKPKTAKPAKPKEKKSKAKKPAKPKPAAAKPAPAPSPEQPQPQQAPSPWPPVQQQR